MNPILVDSMDGIIAGHSRLSAARKLGLAEVPVARKRQAVSGPGIYGGKPLPAKTPEVVFKGDTRDIAGKAVGVSGRTVQAAVAVLKADPEAFQRLKEGKANVYTEAARVQGMGLTSTRAAPADGTKRREMLNNSAKTRMIEGLSLMRGACDGLRKLSTEFIRDGCAPEELDEFVKIARDIASELRSFVKSIKEQQ